MAQAEFHTMLDNWKRLDYQTMYMPSVDRLDDRLGYTMANIQLLTWGANHKKLGVEVGMECNNKYTRKVRQYTLKGELLAEFVSVAEAGRQLGIHTAQIINACTGKNGDKKVYKAKGYQFRYANEAGENIGEVPQKKKGKVGVRSSTGYTGITERKGRWHATIWYNKKSMFIGSYLSIGEAINAYKSKKEELVWVT